MLESSIACMEKIKDVESVLSGISNTGTKVSKSSKKLGQGLSRRELIRCNI